MNPSEPMFSFHVPPLLHSPSFRTRVRFHSLKKSLSITSNGDGHVHGVRRNGNIFSSPLPFLVGTTLPTVLPPRRPQLPVQAPPHGRRRRLQGVRARRRVDHRAPLPQRRFAPHRTRGDGGRHGAKFIFISVWAIVLTSCFVCRTRDWQRTVASPARIPRRFPAPSTTSAPRSRSRRTTRALTSRGRRSPCSSSE